MKKYRNEWKYILPAATLSGIENRLRAVMETDSFADEEGRYDIHSLYMDDLFDSSVMENNAGISERFKYRIRYYGDNKEFLRLERKEKKNGLCHKESCILTKDEYDLIVSGDVGELAYCGDKPVLRQYALDSLKSGFMPKAIIDYERVAFVEPITNVRVTLDRNISASASTEDFLTGDYIKAPVQDKLRHVLEVKFDDILPGHIRNVLNEQNLVQTSFSKYYLGRSQLKKMGW